MEAVVHDVTLMYEVLRISYLSVRSGLVLVFLLILGVNLCFLFPFSRSILFIILFVVRSTAVAIWKNKARTMRNWQHLATGLS